VLHVLAGIFRTSSDEFCDKLSFHLVTEISNEEWNMRALIPLAFALLCYIPNLRAAEFTDNFRIEDYLVKAVELQKLEPEKRTARLREMAKDPDQAVPVIPLCRMLFEAKPEAKFRRPMLGLPHSVKVEQTDGMEMLEPITLYDGIPILTTWGYNLGGEAESASQYLSYCLTECRWRKTNFSKLEKDQIGKIVEQFIALQKSPPEDQERLRAQAK
jgi:hypothetical protein